MNTTEAPEKLYVNVDEFANQGEGIFVAGDLRMFVADVEYLKATSVQPELDRLRREIETSRAELAEARKQIDRKDEEFAANMRGWAVDATVRINDIKALKSELSSATEAGGGVARRGAD